MNRSNELDTQAKRLIRATKEPIRLLLGVGRLDQGLIDEIALAIDFTALAWQSNPRPAIQVLPAIRQRVAARLAESRFEGREREVGV